MSDLLTEYPLFRMPDFKCPEEPHVHVDVRGHHASVNIVGEDFAGRNGYGEALSLRWHGIAPFPHDWSEFLGVDPVIARRLEEYVA